MAIAIHFPLLPKREMQRDAASAEAVILIHSFATRIDMRRRRGFSMSSWISEALGWLDSLSWKSLIGPSEKRAVSEPEKNAEKQRSIKIRMILTRIKSSKV